MKLVDRHEKIVMTLGVIGGVVLGAYILYEQRQIFGVKELIIISLILLIAVLLVYLIIKKANK